MTPSERDHGRLHRTLKGAEGLSGYLLWFAGVVLIVNAVFEIGSLIPLAAHPRVFIAVLGVLAWLAGSLARDSQRKANRLERKLEDCQEVREEYRRLAFDNDD